MKRYWPLIIPALLIAVALTFAARYAPKFLPFIKPATKTIDTTATPGTSFENMQHEPGIYAIEDALRGMYGDGDSIYTSLAGLPGSFLVIRKDVADGAGAKLKFYRLHKNNWKLLNSYSSDWNLYWQFGDVNFDGVEDIIGASGRNMNGNSSRELFIYNRQADTFAFAGALMGEAYLDSAHHFICEDYSGSWYMPMTRTLYNWNSNKLNTLKQIAIEYPGEPNRDSNLVITYQVNKLKAGAKLETAYTAVQNSADEFQDSLWENFYNPESAK